MLDVKTLDLLRRFEYDIDGETFRRLFVECDGSDSMAVHLWDKFHEFYDHSVLRLWSALDDGNRKILLDLIAKWRSLPKE